MTMEVGIGAESRDTTVRREVGHHPMRFTTSRRRVTIEAVTFPPTMPEQPSSAAIAEPRIVAPVELDQRIHTLDILRGLALFGMILVHFHQKMRLEVEGVEGLISWGVWIFVEEKAWGTFAFLFGVGFAVLLRRLEARGAPVASIYLRRLAALAAFGVVAQVGFGFTILFDYAFWGVALLLVRSWSTRKLLALAVMSACVYPIITEVSVLHALWTASPPAAPRVDPSYFRALTDAEQHGSYLTLLALRWAGFVRGLPHDWRGFVPGSNLVLFVLGLLALRHGVLEQPKRHLRLIRRWMIFGAVSWAMWWVLTLLVDPRLPKGSIPGPSWPVFTGFGLLQEQWLSFTYVGAVVLLLAYRPQWTARLAFFGSAGRMALTNYMLQVVVLDVLSSGYGFGLKLRPYVYVVCAVVLFVIEVALSRAWLVRYRFGPLEWLWRTITYAKWQPLRREAPATLAPAAA